jgi:beta-barrel assembly-enhancing protease
MPARSGRTGNSAWNSRMRAWPLVLTMQLAAALPAAAQTAASELPDIGNPANTALSLEDEYKIGLMIVRSMRDAGQIVEDPEINEYLQSLGMRLSSQAHEGAHRFTFFAVRDPGINAFALPGGFIGVNAGLVTATKSEGELAGVIAHEIAHVTQRHIARSIQNAGRANMASLAGMLAAILIGATTGMPSDAVLGGVTAAQGLAAQNQINFTRANEAEADRVGIGILASAGFDPVAMPDFFNTMQQRSGGAGHNIPDLLRSHPVTSERIAETRDRASRMARPRNPDSTGYALIRDRLQLEILSDEVQPRDLFATAKSADYPSTDAEQYGRALALMRADAPEEAIPALQALLDRRPDVTLYHTALGQAQLAAGRVDASKATLENAMKLFPRNVPVTLRYAETLMRAGDAKRAHLVLLDLFNNVPPTAEQVRFTALAANAAGDVADSYYYMSEYHVISGNLALAINQLRLAQAVPGINAVQRERFDARIRELEEYLPKGKRAREVAEPQGGGSEPGGSSAPGSG